MIDRDLTFLISHLDGIAPLCSQSGLGSPVWTGANHIQNKSACNSFRNCFDELVTFLSPADQRFRLISCFRNSENVKAQRCSGVIAVILAFRQDSTGVREVPLSTFRTWCPCPFARQQCFARMYLLSATRERQWPVGHFHAETKTARAAFLKGVKQRIPRELFFRSG